MGSLLVKPQQQRVEPQERTAAGPGANGAEPEPTTETQQQRSTYAPSKWDVWMLGITIVLGGQYFSWNAGLAAGLYSYLLVYFLIAGAYITLCCCTSEVTGALPFAGGAYGLSRCTLGFFPGYLIGCCEALEYIAYVAASVVSLAQMIVEAAPSLEGLEPAIALAFYASALCFHTRGDRRVFWVFNMALGSTSLLIVVLYCLGSLPFVSFAKNAASDPSLQFVNGFAGFMKALPLAAWFFVGVEALSLASDEVAQPKVVIPFAQIACVLTLFASGLAVFFVAVSLPPGLASLPNELVPFNNGFTLLFHTSQRFATILSIPATYATAYGFMWCYGKLIAAMAHSRLLPPCCGRAPYAGICCGSALSYFICVLVHFCPCVGTYLFSVGITCAFMSYTGQCIGYLSLRLSYRNIKSSSFRNPFGVGGAIYSMSVWVLAIVAIACFQGNGGVEIFAFACILMVLAVYYYSCAKKRQTFSAHENRILLVAHVMKFNGRRAATAASALKRKSASSDRYRSNVTPKGNTAATNNTSTHSTGPAPAVVLGSSRSLKATSRVAAGGSFANVAKSADASAQPRILAFTTEMGPFCN
ncbi:Atp-binding protein [Globisporangium polare]